MIYMSMKAIESNELSGVFNVIYVKKIYIPGEWGTGLYSVDDSV